MDRQALFAKKETAYGTPATLTAADVLHVENVKYVPKGDLKKGDPAKPGYGGVPGVWYGEHGELTFDVPLAASGTAGVAPKWGFLILACGWGEAIIPTTSVTYALADPEAADSITFKWRDARRAHQLIGARGQVSLKAAVGERPMLSFRFLGLHTIPTPAATVKPADVTWTGWLDSLPIQQGRTTFSFDGVAMTMRDFSIDSSDNVVFTDVPHQENVELLGERTLTAKFKAGTPDLAVFNAEAKWLAGGILVQTLVHNVGSPGEIVTVNSRGQLGIPSYGRDKGQDMMEASVELVGSNLGTDDDIAIILT